MEIKVCKNCKRLFKYMFGPELCPDCTKILTQEKLEQEDQTSYDGPTLRSPAKDEISKFEQVRDYIMTHPKATVAEISEIMDVPPTKIFEWIKNERLEFTDESKHAWFTCEKCGVKIKSGRLCNRCKIR